MQMDSESTREIVQRFLTARAQDDAGTMAGLLSDDAEWHPPTSTGAGPFVGPTDVVAGLRGGLAGRYLDVSTITREVEKVVVEGDTAVVVQTLRASTPDGTPYENRYCWVYTCQDGKISRLDEYVDTLLAARTFAPKRR
jgi:ketosteroid isomerase-like protein